MENFEQDVMSLIKSSMVRQLKDVNWFNIPYGERPNLPSSLINGAWSLVDADVVKAEIADLLQRELANRVVNAMAAEISTDIKQVLSVKERREAIRSLVRDNIDKLTRV